MRSGGVDIAGKRKQIAADLDRLFPALSVERALAHVDKDSRGEALALAAAFPGAELWILARKPAARAGFQDSDRLHVVAADLGTSEGEGKADDLPCDGDAFCEQCGIERLDYVRLAAERNLEVLRGFQRMLGTYAISLLEVDVGMNRANRDDVPLERLTAYLEPMGYDLIRLYAQASLPGGPARLHRCTAVFGARPATVAPM